MANETQNQILNSSRRIENLLGGTGNDGGVSSEKTLKTLATESTLISLLNHTIDTQDIEVLLVRDTGASDKVVQQIREYTQPSGPWVTSYEDVSGNAYTPAGPLEYLDPSAVLNLMLAEELSQGIAISSQINLLTSILNKIIAAPATEAKQDTLITALGSLLTELQAKADLTETQPVSAAALPLPTGASTEAKQDTGNTSLGTIAGDTTSIDAKLPAQGAALTAASTPVNIASDQIVPVSASSLPLPSGAATETTQATLATQATLSLLENKDFATQSTLQGVSNTNNNISDKSNIIAAATQSMDVNTANIQTNGVTTSQKVTSIDNKTPALGQAAMSQSVPVTIASNQSNVPVAIQTTARTFSAVNVGIGVTFTAPAGCKYIKIFGNAHNMPGIVAVNGWPVDLSNKSYFVEITAPAGCTITGLVLNGIATGNVIVHYLV